MPEHSHPTAETLLRTIFGYQQFKSLQSEVIQNVLDRRDTLAIMPTGGGKSLCYQIPSLIFPGLTVVVSPLIALMKDQVEQLDALGVPALFLNSSLAYDEYRMNMARVRSGEIKLLYVAPETLLTPRLLAQPVRYAHWYLVEKPRLLEIGSAYGLFLDVAKEDFDATGLEISDDAAAFARKNGVDPAKVREALMGGFAGSRILEVHGKRMLDNEYKPGFKTRLHQKDLNIVMQTARELGLSLPGAALVMQHLNALMGTGDAELDSAAVMKIVERASGMAR
mgnify:CR=1 FL=1